MSRSRELIFVDPSVAGWESIVERAGVAMRVVLLDSTQDGLAQIATALAGESGLAAIHIVSHGSAGQISLGNSGIDAASLGQHAAALAQIRASLADDGDILLYGCDIGKGTAGGIFLQQLARATGADIAASTDLTGAAALGGDWVLEASTGAVTAASLEAKGYAGTLAIIAGTANSEQLEGGIGDDTISGYGGDDILIGGAGNDTLDGGAEGHYGDTVDYAQGPAGVTVNLQNGTAIDNWGNTDTLVGIEHVTGSAHDDTLIGSTGRNWFRPGMGNDAVFGNGGDDVVMYEGGSADMNVDLRAGTASGAEIGTDTLNGIRSVHAGHGSDTIQLSDASGYVFARSGDDILNGGTGNDGFHGGSGNDTINGGAGIDTAEYIEEYDGGSGSVLTGLGVTVNLATGLATDNWGNTDTLSGIENVGGSRHADTVIGSAGDNQLSGQAGNDTIEAGAGRDWLDGGAGDDTLRGGDGDDGLVGGSGADTLDGGAGINNVHYGNDYDTTVPLSGLGVSVNLAAGSAVDNWGHADKLIGIQNASGSRLNDTLTGNTANNNLNGEAGHDTIAAGDGNDFLHGGSGNDKLDGGNGNDTFVGGAGTDNLAGGAGIDRADYWNDYDAVSPTGQGVTVNLATGTARDNWGNTDTLSGIEDVTGSRYADSILGSAGDNSLAGEEGDDTIIAGDGRDNLRGGSGGDSLQGGLGDDYLTGGAGVDGLDGGDGRDTVDYRDEYDRTAAVTGLGVAVNLATGLATDNWGHADTLAGIEDVNGSRYNDTITGSAGTNNLLGWEGSDTIAAGEGMDWVDGGDGADNLDGGAGDDRLVGGEGADILNGGDGRDGAYYWHASGTAPITGKGANVNLATGIAVDSWGHTDKLISIEDVNGTDFGDGITGSAVDNNLFAGKGNDTVRAGAGNDWLDGGDGNDNLLGEAGNDSFVGGAGTDRIDGGEGTDQVTYWHGLPTATVGVTVNLTTGTARDNWGNTDTLIGIENVTGSNLNDTITGSALDNNLRGEAGDDVIVAGDGRDYVNGGAGNDKLQGGAGDDNLYGEDGNDTLSADDGNDNLDGGNGDDLLQGGSGNNRFTGGAGADTIDGGAGFDSVTYTNDFNSALPATGMGITVNLVTGSVTDNWGDTDTLLGIETVTGSRFADIMIGDAGNNNLYGFDGDDLIQGGDGIDNLGGGNGDDKLYGEAGRDRFQGDAGNDTIDGGVITDLIGYTDGNSVSYMSAQKGVVVNLASNKVYDSFGGVDTLANINSAIGSMHDDVLTGSSRAVLEIFEGGDGDDVINGGAVTDRYNDTNGNRVTYYYAGSAVEVDLALGTASGGGGNDILANITQVYGSTFDDTLMGSNTDLVEQFQGDAGNDLIDGRGGLDQAVYMYAVTGVNVNLATGIALDGLGGTDELVDIEGVRGSNFDDTLIGGNPDNGDAPGEGLEFFNGDNGNDTIDGGAGFDRADYATSIAAVTVVLGGTSAGSAADGFGSTDVLLNIEAVRGSNFGDVLTGSDTGAFESFEGRGGNDVIDGKGGIDLIDYSYAGAAVNVNLTTGVATDGQGGTDKILNIEQVRGSLIGSDSLTGNAQANMLEGFGGNDSLNGGGGTDTMIGGDGNDTYHVDNAGDLVLETNARTAGGIDTVNSAISYTLGANVENLRLLNGDTSATGNGLNNLIYAGTGVNAIDGGLGSDTLSFQYAVASATSGTGGVTLGLGAGGALTTASGISGADTVRNIENLIGSKYNDSLTGNASVNTINGGEGSDYLNGGSGNDVLTGGGGADWFTFNTALSNTDNVDTITDFALEDTIRLENAVFTKLATTGALSAANFKVVGSSALDADDFIQYDKASGYLYYDADGSGAGAAVKIALVGANLALTSGDFTIF